MHIYMEPVYIVDEHYMYIKSHSPPLFSISLIPDIYSMVQLALEEGERSDRGDRDRLLQWSETHDPP